MLGQYCCLILCYPKRLAGLCQGHKKAKSAVALTPPCRANRKENDMNPFTEEFMANPENMEFLRATMMGPSAMRLAEELAGGLDIHPGSKVLDLGCGCGLSTLLLVKKYGATVFAADLWVSPAENNKRFEALRIADRAIPLLVDVTKGLPFAERYFDLLFTVDAYHYFGDTPQALPALAQFVKRGGIIAAAVPGLRWEFGKNVPAEMRPFWNSEVERTMHSLPWWQQLWAGEESVELLECREMACCKQAWAEWLTAYHPVVANDIQMMQAEGGKYFNLIQLVAKVR